MVREPVRRVRDFRPALLGRQYGIIWSAKSASAAVLLWHFAAQGLLAKAMAFNPWPHEYLEQKLDTAAKTHPGRPEKARWWIRVIRDPYLRAVSGYRHAVRYNYINGLPAFLGRAVDRHHGFSFLEYLEYLSTQNLAARTCDDHYRIQFQVIERRVPVSLRVNADATELYQALDDFAARKGIAVPERHLIEPLGNVVQTHRAWRVQVDGDASAMQLTSEQATRSWPDYPAFLSADARAMVRRLYREDFDAYGDLLQEIPAPKMASSSHVPSDFDPAVYLRLHEDVAKSGMDAAMHYVQFGKREGRRYRDQDHGVDPMTFS